MKSVEAEPRERADSGTLRRRASFLTGLATIFDFAGNTRRTPPDPDADARAIASDWRAVGDALRWAMGRYEQTPEYQEALRAHREKAGAPEETDESAR